MIIFNIIMLLLLLNVLIFVHEMAHIIMAKRAGVKVYEFCIGFPPKILKFKYHGTLYAIGLIPFGGFVKIEGEGGVSKRKDAFVNKTFGQKLKILLAGVTVNYLLAVMIFSILFMVGINQNGNNIEIKSITGGTLASQYLKESDIIVGYDNHPEKGTIGIQEYLQYKKIDAKDKASEVILNIKRGGNDMAVIIPVAAGTDSIGFSYQYRQEMVKYSPGLAIVNGFKKSNEFGILGVQRIKEIPKMIKYGFEKKSTNVVGSLVEATGAVINSGWRYYFEMFAMLSAIVAIFNILPIPALDGWKAMIVVGEKISKKRMPEKLDLALSYFVFALFILATCVIIFQDLIKVVIK